MQVQDAITHWGRDIVAAIQQTTFSNLFSCTVRCHYGSHCDLYFASLSAEMYAISCYTEPCNSGTRLYKNYCIMIQISLGKDFSFPAPSQVHGNVVKGIIISSLLKTILQEKDYSLWSSYTLWQHRSGSTLDQVMACSTKSLPEPMMTYHKQCSVVHVYSPENIFR